MNTVLSQGTIQVASRPSRPGRKGYAANSVVCWMKPKESFADAKARLDQAWEDGFHPVQIMQQNKELVARGERPERGPRE